MSWWHSDWAPDLRAGLWGVSVGLISFWLLSPEHFLPAGRPWVVVAEECPHVVALLEDVATRADVREAIVVLPADSADGPVGGEACKLASRSLREEAWWFRAVPEAWICARLREHVARLNLFGYPSWIHRGQVLRSVRARDAVLADVGLAVSSDSDATKYFDLAVHTVPEGDLDRGEASHELTDDTPRRLEKGVFWRGRPMGL